MQPKILVICIRYAIAEMINKHILDEVNK
ncbi:hypothetical protein Silverhawkium_gp103 [Shigella phage Silverhawkium]|uniref:Uncharacterized protein n=1 Tax=Shigella phage Silverhawkium TaxID=2530185 RepID=A0A482JLD9_9CAUD|nr:hypothetical protein Silverhawkium_gp103 [Shigella phage Silverhawkium]